MVNQKILRKCLEKGTFWSTFRIIVDVNACFGVVELPLQFTPSKVVILNYFRVIADVNKCLRVIELPLQFTP